MNIKVDQPARIVLVPQTNNRLQEVTVMEVERGKVVPVAFKHLLQKCESPQVDRHL